MTEETNPAAEGELADAVDAAVESPEPEPEEVVEQEPVIVALANGCHATVVSRDYTLEREDGAVNVQAGFYVVTDADGEFVAAMPADRFHEEFPVHEPAVDEA